MTLAKKAFACFLLRVDPNHFIVIREIFADCFTENKKDIHRIEDWPVSTEMRVHVFYKLCNKGMFYEMWNTRLM